MLLTSRLVGALLFGLGALQAARSFDLRAQVEDSWYYVALAAAIAVGTGVGFVLGSVAGRWLSGRLSAFEVATDRRSASELLAGTGGLVVGLIAAILAGFAVLQLPFGIGRYLLLPVVLIIAYAFARVAARRHRDIFRLVGIRSRAGSAAPPRVIDTSAIIDGRVADVLATRFLSGQVVVPAFVLEELQKVADSSDPIKRARGRRGLELVEKLKADSNGGFSVRRTDYPEIDEVDAKLVRTAEEIGGSIVTTDFNLNKVAQIHDVDVLNVNDLANALKPAVLPGERMKVRVIREGREYNQGVGYLDDGTMIVVEGGRKHLGREVDVEVTSVLQNPSGKMVFTKRREDASDV